MAVRFDGKFAMGDPMKGKVKHHKENQVYVATESEAADLIKNHGYSIRVESLKGQGAGLVRKGLFHDGAPLT